MTELTANILRDLLDYNPNTGVLTWKARQRKWFNSDHAHNAWNARYQGKEAFTSINGQGYRQAKIFGRNLLVHRVIWIMEIGHPPEWQIDHINGKRDDNRWCNLRDATPEENGRNRRRSKSNTSGETGVSWIARRGKWQATIYVDGRNISLGHFDCIENATAARRKANQAYDFHTNHGSAI